VSSARKLKFYDRRDLNDLVRNHLEEKQQVPRLFPPPASILVEK
jgi:hypothetical protein